MRKTRILVTTLSVLALLIVNLVTVGLMTSSAYEIKSGAPSTETDTGSSSGSGAETAEARKPAVVTPAKAPAVSNSGGGETTAKRDETIESEREESGYKGWGWIDGLKFVDLNENGIRDPGEPGLAGVAFTASFIVDTWAGPFHIYWPIIKTAVSGSDGKFSFIDLVPGVWTVEEGPVPGYHNTTPATLQVPVGKWQGSSVEFGNAPDKPPVGSLKAMKFLDLNENGSWDDGEPGEEGLSIEVTGKDVSYGPETKITGADGWVEFNNLPLGTYKVELTGNLPGYHLTTPGVFEVTLSGEEATVPAVYFGNAEDDELGRIYGYKWEENRSGTNQYPASSTAPLEGVTIELSQGGGIIATTTTGIDGYYEFAGLEAGDYTVSEVLPNGYKAVWPVLVDVNLSEGGEVQVDFKNARIVGSISGTKWNDLDGDGVLLPSHPTLEGVTIELWLDGQLVATTVTDSDGNYAFYGLGEGEYTVQEVVPSGMYATSPVSVGVSLAEGQDRTGVDFLNSPYAKIFGYKWSDLNGNAQHDQDDEALEGVTIELSQAGGVIATTTTNAEGYYEFTGLTAGDYTVSEVLPDGYKAVWPVSVDVNGLLPGEAREVDFLNESISLTGSISGTKWLDSNADGLAGGETPLAGVTIQLWIGTELQDTAITGADGTYKFENLPAGDYVVMEAVPSNMYPTSTTSIPVTLADGENRTGVDFLNAMYGSINGTKWDDPDQNGLHDPGEEPVAGVTITLSGPGLADVSVVTDSSGKYSFNNLEAGTYTITETLPAGTKNTSPLSVTVVLKPGETLTIDFLNVSVGGEIVVPPDETATTTSGTLPYTGMNQTGWYILAAAIMLAGLLAMLLGVFHRLAMGDN